LFPGLGKHFLKWGAKRDYTKFEGGGKITKTSSPGAKHRTPTSNRTGWTTGVALNEKTDRAETRPFTGPWVPMRVLAGPSRMG